MALVERPLVIELALVRLVDRPLLCALPICTIPEPTTPRDRDLERDLPRRDSMLAALLLEVVVVTTFVTAGAMLSLARLLEERSTEEFEESEEETGVDRRCDEESWRVRGGRRLLATGCSAGKDAGFVLGGATGAQVASVVIGCFIQLETDASPRTDREVRLCEDVTLLFVRTTASNASFPPSSANATHSDTPATAPPPEDENVILLFKR